jgi:hypothetical protein
VWMDTKPLSSYGLGKLAEIANTRVANGRVMRISWLSDHHPYLFQEGISLKNHCMPWTPHAFASVRDISASHDGQTHGHPALIHADLYRSAWGWTTVINILV